ncbi:MAG TPA: hypothetical protein PKM58_06145 [Pyrinomonadaceae bacterium]|nr:hypothetical protein [Pyrinomonadaceae bacterium]HNU08094.1 hypothetical protein [Pyrinomonadaceae bacterium]
MRKLIHETTCPRCLSPNLKGWSDLDPDERTILERHPRTARIPPDERKKHRFCMRCLYSDSGRVST